MRLGILGCGWLGTHIADYFANRHMIYTTTTSQKKVDRLKEKGYQVSIIGFSDENFQKIDKWKVLNELDILIVTVPFSSKSSMEQLAIKYSNLASFIHGFKNQMFLMSSTGVYPQIEIDITEDTFMDQQLNPSIHSIEALMKENFEQINILRLGGLMGGNRVYSNYVRPTTDTSKNANHIHYEDICSVIDTMIHKKIQRKTYNVVAPIHPTKQEIINQQTNKNVNTPKSFTKRIVLSNYLIEDLNYKFNHPNPVYFI